MNHAAQITETFSTIADVLPTVFFTVIGIVLVVRIISSRI